MSKLYFDMISGISGDMTLGVLIQAAKAEDCISEYISDFIGEKIDISLKDVFINGILCKRSDIAVAKPPHIHRDYHYIKDMIENSALGDDVKRDAIGIFWILAEAEGKVHGIDPYHVHFHEVGSVDSIIDIVGTALLMNMINPSYISGSPAVFGYGSVYSSHGIIPVPAPATSNIMLGVPFIRKNIDSELTTPTGAAILKYYVKEYKHQINGVMKEIYYSTGNKTFENLPNMLRLLILEDYVKDNDVVLIETNIDDMQGELFGYLMEKLFKSGALDVYFTPIFMKKNRPAYKVTALAALSSRDKIAGEMMVHSTTGGVRFYNAERYTAEREIFLIECFGEQARVKRFSYNGSIKLIPEWDDVYRIAEKLSISAFDVYNRIVSLSNNIG